MKRHPSLQVLSHDHHHGLVQARHLRQAAKASAVSTPAAVAATFLRVWTDAIQPHFRSEEEVLFPALARYGDIHLPPIARTLLEHVELRRLIDDLEQEVAAGVPALSTMDSLGKLLQEHIRYEEEVVFPLIEATLPEAALVALAKRLHPATEG